MSIKTQIDRLTNIVVDTYAALADAGAAMPDLLNADNLSETARSVIVTAEDIDAICGGALIKYLRGTVTSDANGVIRFPELDFTPSKIVVWDIYEVNQRELAAKNGFDFDEAEWLTEYTYEGELYVAVYQYDLWVTQTTGYVAGLSYVTDNRDIVTVNGNVYSFNVNVAESQYNYAIYE